MEGSVEQKDTKQHCRIFSVSDIHTDEQANWDLVQSWLDDKDQYNRETGKCYYLGSCFSFAGMIKFTIGDVLIVAGDISEDLDVIVETFNLLKQIFEHIF